MHTTTATETEHPTNSRCREGKYCADNGESFGVSREFCLSAYSAYEDDYYAYEAPIRSEDYEYVCTAACVHSHVATESFVLDARTISSIAFGVAPPAVNKSRAGYAVKMRQVVLRRQISRFIHTMSTLPDRRSVEAESRLKRLREQREQRDQQNFAHPSPCHKHLQHTSHTGFCQCLTGPGFDRGSCQCM
jgi:hypothetical protein